MFDLVKDLRLYTGGWYSVYRRAYASFEVVGPDYLVPVLVSLRPSETMAGDDRLVFTVSGAEVLDFLSIPSVNPYGEDLKTTAIMKNFNLSIEDLENGATIIIRINKADADLGIRAWRPDMVMRRLLLDKKDGLFWKPFHNGGYRLRSALLIIYVLFGIELPEGSTRNDVAEVMKAVSPSDFGIRDVRAAFDLVRLVNRMLVTQNLSRPDIDGLTNLLAANGRGISIGSPRLPWLKNFFNHAGKKTHHNAP